MSAYQTPIPGAPQYEQANLLARRAYENAMTRLNTQRSQSLLQHGYTRDAQGNLSVDANNEFGGYQQMLRGQDQQSHHLERAQHASGWGGGGYLGQQTEDLQHGQGADQAQFGQQFENELAGYNQDEQDAAYTRDQSLYQNEQNAAEQAIQQGNFNPADYSDINVPYGQQAQAPPPKGGGGKGHLKDMPSIHQRGRAQIMRRLAAQRQRAKGRRR